MRGAPEAYRPAHDPSRCARIAWPPARPHAVATVDARRPAPRLARCGRGAPFTPTFLVRLVPREGPLG